MRKQLFWQFIAETILITLLAVILAFALAQLGLPFLNNLFKTHLTINPFINSSLLFFIVVIVCIVVFLSGSYPALVLSGFKPIAALKGKLSQKNVGGFSLRRGLVITQFAISQLLIIGAIIIAGQMSFSKNTYLGFSKNNIVMLPVPVNDSIGKLKMQLLKNELREIPNVQQVSFCMEAPASQHFDTKSLTYDNRSKEEPWSVISKPADDQYIPTFNLKLVAGRNMYASDTINQYIVNETVVKKLGLQSPRQIISKNITVDGITAPVVGVVKDFYNNSFHNAIAPVVLFSAFYNYENCAVKISSQNMQSTLTTMEKTWNSVYPQYAYNKEFLDDRIAHFYALDDTMLKLIEFFAGIAILIGCLGLYGLVSFMALQKTKEIGVRKVLGARVTSVLWLFGKEFSRLLIIAFVIAAPIGWWLMNKYLQNFKYRVQIGAGVFVLAILITFFIAMITVGYRSIKAAIANPVNSLRTE